MKKNFIFATLSIIFFALCLISPAANAYAAIKRPFASRDDDKPIVWDSKLHHESDSVMSVCLMARIAPGWHLYGTEMPETDQPCPVPTTVIFDECLAIEFVSDLTAEQPALMRNDETFGIELPQWENQAVLYRKFRVTDNSQPLHISGSIRYMGCDGSMCLPPQTYNFNLSVNSDKLLR